ncbi:MAG: hypothetical protein LBL66_07410 [Clostridiales bacterium]|jgi:hypothetical protein|nr:hypothetical protein [Clostridiales bacterium]
MSVFYRKQLKIPVKPLRSVRLTDFSRGMSRKKDENILPLSYAALAYNYAAGDGALKDGLGFSGFSHGGRAMAGIEGETVLRVWHYRKYDWNANRPDDRLVAYAESGKLYARPLLRDGDFAEIGARFSAPPNALNYRLYGEDVILFCSASENMAVWDGVNAPRVIADSPRITSMDIHAERLFATVDGDKRQIWFSEDLDPTNWDLSPDNAGFIEMADERGALLRAVGFLDYVYVFREYGISRIAGTGAQEEFSAAQLFVSSGRIRPDTIAVCGDCILFMADDGLFAFNGLHAERVLDHMRPMLATIANGSAAAAYHNSKYYLACRLNYGDGREVGCETQAGFINNTVLELDLSSMCCNLSRGVDARHFCAVRTEGSASLCACTDGKLALAEYSGAAFGQPLEKLWRAPETDFGTDRVKVLKAIALQTDAPLVVTVESEEGVKSVCFSGARGVQRARVNLKGRVIKAAFKSETCGVRVTSPILYFDLI